MHHDVGENILERRSEHVAGAVAIRDLVRKRVVRQIRYERLQPRCIPLADPRTVIEREIRPNSKLRRRSFDAGKPDVLRAEDVRVELARLGWRIGR